MDVNIYDIDSVADEQIEQKIKNHESFIIECPDFLKVSKGVEKLEKIIEAQGMRCRIYTIGRVATIGAAAWTGIGTVIAAGAGLAIAAHNVATWSPDYEIATLPLGTKIVVTYKKK